MTYLLLGIGFGKLKFFRTYWSLLVDDISKETPIQNNRYNCIILVLMELKVWFYDVFRKGKV